jgi:site-specific recombinase XerD
VDQYRRKEKGCSEEKSLFLSETHRPLTPNAVTQLFVRLNARAGLTDHPISPSMLRETFAVHYLQAGGNPLTLQTLLGRVDLATIKRYQQVSERIPEKGYSQEKEHLVT